MTSSTPSLSIFNNMGRLAGLFQPLDFVNHTKQKQQELLQLRQVKRTSQDSTNELII